MSDEIKALVRSVFTWIGQGFLFGLGFGLAALITVFAGEAFFSSKAKSTASDFDKAFYLGSAAEQFVISNVEEIKTKDQFYFVGTVTNKSARSVRNLDLEVNLFDKNKKFVDQYTAYASGDLLPGASKFFKINGGCKGNLPIEHETFKVQVVGGH